MPNPSPKSVSAAALVVATVFGFGATAPLHAQPAAQVHPTQLDPSDLFYQAFLLRRAADQLEKDGDYTEAWNKLSQAQKMIETVRRFHPDWKSSMVEGRYEINKTDGETLRPKAEEQARKKRGALAELEGGQIKSGEYVDPADGLAPLTPGILEVDPLATRRLEEAEAEVERLKALLKNPDQAVRDASRLRDVERQRNALNSELRAAQARERALRAKLASQPMNNELDKLNDRIQSLEMEREAMAKALNQSRESNLEAETRRQTLEADLLATRHQPRNR